MFEEQIIGFDARCPPADVKALWTPRRRFQYLLRPGIDCPLSTDTLVWPSLFRSNEQSVNLTGKELLRVPKWIGPNPPLWESLAALRDCIALNQKQIPPAYSPIAVTWLSDSQFAKADPSFGPYLLDQVPVKLDAAWQSLGYDVSDGSLLSGLSNCGYGADEARELRKQWGMLINGYGLFTDPQQALEFTNVTNLRVPEHAPFFVFGIWLMSPA